MRTRLNRREKPELPVIKILSAFNHLQLTGILVDRIMQTPQDLRHHQALPLAILAARVSLNRVFPNP
jgi:hypothetical protein